MVRTAEDVPTPIAGRRAPAPEPARLSAAVLPALPGPGDPPLPVWPGEPVEVDGTAVFVRRTPAPADAEPALFVHGLGGSSSNWTDVTSLLSATLSCESLDLPGFGRSDPPPRQDYSLDAHARCVARLIEVRGRGPVHLVGNSLGGAVSTRVAATRPDLVRTLTLVSPALPDLRVRRGGDAVVPLLLVPGLRELASRRLAAQDAEARARAVLDLCYHDPSRVSPERLREAAEEVRRRTALPWGTDAFAMSLRGLVAAYLHRGPTALWRQAAAVRAPVLLVWGRHDRLTDVRVAARAVSVFPDARLLVLDDAGHVAQLERPETVARAVLGRLEELAEAGEPAA